MTYFQVRRTFASAVLGKLVNWAAVSLEKSINQPTLPHLIIALNATESSRDEYLWDIDMTTAGFLDDYKDAIKEDGLVQKVTEWEAKGVSINTTKDLLKCYYASVTIVRLPRKEQYMLLDAQVRKLRERIIASTAISQYEKHKKSMLLNSEDLQFYLEAAFDHFARGLDKPFNFVEIALKNNPIPRDLGQNIVKLAVMIRDLPGRPSVQNIFLSLAPLVASCIMLDIVRERRMGI
jgi:hypothetical protein